MTSTFGVVRVSSVWSEHPVPTDRFAVIGLRARNYEAGRLSLTASGLVRDSVTGDWITTSNPEPHYRDALRGRFNPLPASDDVIDFDDLDAWRTDCETRGYEINAIIEGGSVRDVLARIAAAGYAVPRMSNEWGVVRGRPTEGEAPVMVFTPRDARDIRTEVAFPDLPDGLRLKFRDASRNYLEREIIYPDSARGGLLQEVVYPDEITEDGVRRRAAIELRQLRETVAVSWDCGTASLGFRRGDLVTLVEDTISEDDGFARVVGWTENGSGAVTAIRIDGTVPVRNTPDWFTADDWFAGEDFFAEGKVSGVALRPANGLPMKPVALLANDAGETSELILAEPLEDSGIHVDAMVLVGVSQAVQRRLVVSSMTRRGDFEATITGVPEIVGLYGDAMTFNGAAMAFNNETLTFEAA
jgi:hypothetical protein